MTNHHNMTILKVPDELKTKLKHLALDAHTGLSAFIIKILHNFVKGEEKER